MKKFKEEVVKALLPQITLELAQKQPIHGYALISYIREKYGVYLGPSTVYPTLKQLEEYGFLTSEWQLTDRPRKVFTPTTTGLTLFNETALTLRMIVSETAKLPYRLYEAVK